ncbi:MAG: MurR/RpiR family transcriptional regulator [Lachnospiraceae bacterium]|nr:MurR/RpiR family transcriptional regulator [Lachnospiraceae bacterium]
MFSYEVINSFNDLEMQVYTYVLEHKDEVKYMTIRALADAVHVSTATISRFCKKVGCSGYAEFKVQFKLYLNEKRQKQPETDLKEVQRFFEEFYSEAYQKMIDQIVEEIQNAEHLLFFGIGTSGILGKYGARYFSNLGKYSQFIEDPFYPISMDLKSTVAIALSVSGETQQVISLAGLMKEHCCKLISITDRESTTLGKMSDYNLTYYVTNRKIGRNYDITTQVPVIFLLETLGRRVTNYVSL